VSEYLVELATQQPVFEVMVRYIQVNEGVNHDHEDRYPSRVVCQGDQVKIGASTRVNSVPSFSILKSVVNDPMVLQEL